MTVKPCVPQDNVTLFCNAGNLEKPSQHMGAEFAAYNRSIMTCPRYTECSAASNAVNCFSAFRDMPERHS